MYTLIGNPKNRSFRVLWALEELGVPYEIKPYAPRSDEMKSVNPSGKAPALQVDDTLIFDSAAICTYLADKHGQLTHPAGTLERARQDSFLHFALDDFDGTMWTLAKHSFIFPEALRDKAAVKPGAVWDLERAMAAFEERVGDGPWLTGDTFTVADLITVHCINWIIGVGAVEPSKTMRALVEQAGERPAYQRAIAIREAA